MSAEVERLVRAALGMLAKNPQFDRKGFHELRAAVEPFVGELGEGK